RIVGSVERLIVERCILGPVVFAPAAATDRVERFDASDSIVQAVASEPAVQVLGADASFTRCTVLGEARARTISASETILAGPATATDPQHGCVRFSAWLTGSALPRKYE